MMNGHARAQAVYNAVAQNNPNVAKMSAYEQQALLASLGTVFAADVAYLQGAVQVQPGTFATAAGQSVTVAGASGPETGTTTAPAPVTGIGGIQ